MSFMRSRSVRTENEESIRPVDFEWRNPYSASKLSRAVRSMSIDMVKKLIRKGCALDAPDNRGWTPLHDAAVDDKFFDIAQVLIFAGAFVDHKTVEEETPLVIACKNEAEKIVKALIDAGCEVNTQNNECLTPLHIACSRRNQTIIRLLIDAGADLNAKDDEERTPLYLALENVNVAALNILIEAGADLKTKDFFSRTPLQYACMIGNLEIFDILIGIFGSGKEVIDQQTPEGWTLLMEAAQYKNYHIAEKLIEYGTDTTLVDNRRLLALHIAAHSERYNLLELLLQHTPKKTIEKYSTFGKNMTHYRSLPCLIIDKDVFDALELLFDSDLSEDVLKCPAKMGDKLVSPISFLLLHANAVDNENKLIFLEFLLSYDFLLNPEYKLEDFYDYDIKVVSPIEAAVSMHRPAHKNCYCDKYLSLILAKGISPDMIKEDPRSGKVHKHYLLQKAIRYGFTAGIDLLLKYSECTEPDDVLQMILSDIIEPSYLWTGQEIPVVKYLLEKCINYEQGLRIIQSSLESRKNFGEDNWDILTGLLPIYLPIYNLIRQNVRVPSLKELSRSAIRKYSREQAQLVKSPFRKFLRNIKLPNYLSQYILYEIDF